MRKLAILLSVVFAAACTQTPADQTAEVARELCKCLEPGNSTCESTLETQLGTATDACAHCVFADTNACAAMLSDCIPACSNGNGGIP